MIQKYAISSQKIFNLTVKVSTYQNAKNIYATYGESVELAESQMKSHICVLCYHTKRQWSSISFVDPRFHEGARTITRKDRRLSASAVVWRPGTVAHVDVFSQL